MTFHKKLGMGMECHHPNWRTQSIIFQDGHVAPPSSFCVASPSIEPFTSGDPPKFFPNKNPPDPMDHLGKFHHDRTLWPPEPWKSWWVREIILTWPGNSGEWNMIICPDIIQPRVPTGREVSPVVRQSLLHWAYELTLKDFREKQPAILAGGSHWTGKDNKNIYPLVN